MEESIRYVRELQSKYSSQLFLDIGGIVDILKYRKKELNITDKEIKKFLKKISKGSFIKSLEKIYNKHIAEHFLSTLPNEVKEKLKDVYIGILPTYKINACTFKGPNNKPIIILHSQLQAAISQYNEVQFIFGKKFKINEEEACEFLYKSYSEISTCFLYSDFAPKMSLLPAILNTAEYNLMIQKTFLQELFIIAHEYAHIYLGHLDKIETKNLLEDGTMINEYVKSQKMELEADLQAMKWILNCTKSNKLDNTLLYGISTTPQLAIEVFMLFHMLEVNTNRYSNIISNSNKKSELGYLAMRLADLGKQADDLLSNDIIHDNYEHPTALVRMFSIIAKTFDSFDETQKKFLMSMLKNALFYESFKFEN